jgi:hypothetical protein
MSFWVLKVLPLVLREKKIFSGFTCAFVQGVIGFYGFLCGNVSIYAGFEIKRAGVEGVEVLPLRG